MSELTHNEETLLRAIYEADKKNNGDLLTAGMNCPFEREELNKLVHSLEKSGFITRVSRAGGNALQCRVEKATYDFFESKK